MRRKLRELYNDVYCALDDLMYSQMISIDTFIKLDELVKTPLVEILSEVDKNKKNKNSGTSSK